MTVNAAKDRRQAMNNSTACFVDATSVPSALYPRPCPAFCRFWHSKAGEGCVIPHINDISRKWQQYFAHAQYFVCTTVPSPPPPSPHSLDACGKLPVTFAHLGRVEPPATHAQVNSFHHPFYPDITHVTKDTRLSLLLYTTGSNRSWMGGWERG